MKKKFKFTNATIKALPANPKDAKGTDLEVSDTEIVGLKCLSGKNASKRFLLRYTFKSRKCSIAIVRFPEIDVGDARRIASKYKLQLAEGINPQDAKNPINTIPTFSEFFWNTYLPIAKQRKITWNDDVSRFNHHCRFLWNLRYNEIKPVHIQQVQNAMMTATSKREAYQADTCNRVLALIKTVGELAERLLDIPNAATKTLLLPENNARTRYCTIDEVKVSVNLLHCLLFLTGYLVSKVQLESWRFKLEKTVL